MKRRIVTALTLLLYPLICMVTLAITVFLSGVAFFQETQFRKELIYLWAIVRGRA